MTPHDKTKYFQTSQDKKMSYNSKEKDLRKGVRVLIGRDVQT